MRKLPKKYSDIYEHFYLDYSQSNNFFRKISLIVEKWYHLKASNPKFKSNSILELGAGNLNHLKYEKNFREYDVVEPKNYLINVRMKKTKEKSITFINLLMKSQKIIYTTK